MKTMTGELNNYLSCLRAIIEENKRLLEVAPTAELADWEEGLNGQGVIHRKYYVQALERRKNGKRYGRSN